MKKKLIILAVAIVFFSVAAIYFEDIQSVVLNMKMDMDRIVTYEENMQYCNDFFDVNKDTLERFTEKMESGAGLLFSRISLKQDGITAYSDEGTDITGGLLADEEMNQLLEEMRSIGIVSVSNSSDKLMTVDGSKLYICFVLLDSNHRGLQCQSTPLGIAEDNDIIIHEDKVHNRYWYFVNDIIYEVPENKFCRFLYDLVH